jgi:methylated-DNA-[protein]-cysteine S-methyltransferase
MPVKIRYWKSPVGELLLGQSGEALVLCDWRYRKMREAIDRRIQKALGSFALVSDDPFLDETVRQLEEYFRGERRSFSIDTHLVGSDFQARVWQVLGRIPYGQTLTYRTLSEELGDFKAIRAVASANGANALSIFYPCHRVVGSDGSLVGYAGGLAAKKFLLQLEGALVAPQLDLFG